MQVAWSFFQEQILGMKWLNELIGGALASLGLEARLLETLQFFVYDTIKIFVLLTILIFVISYVQSFFPPERTKRILSGVKGIWANLLGALLGTVTPFCSCSSIPLFIGFSNAGLPVGVTFSFLISSPLVDLAAFVLLMGVFGLKIAVAYVVVGIVLAICGGTLIDKLGLEGYVESFVRTGKNVDVDVMGFTRKERLVYAKNGVVEIVAKVWPYVLVGVGIGAVIHNWIPAEVIQTFIGRDNPFSVILATVIGIPIYADVFGTIPIAEALFAKGAGIGTILAFMMAVTALSLPSIIMLKKVVKARLLWTFVGIVAVGIVVIGYLFNAIA